MSGMYPHIFLLYFWDSNTSHNLTCGAPRYREDINTARRDKYHEEKGLV